MQIDSHRQKSIFFLQEQLSLIVGDGRSFSALLALQRSQRRSRGRTPPTTTVYNISHLSNMVDTLSGGGIYDGHTLKGILTFGNGGVGRAHHVFSTYNKKCWGT